MSEVHFIAAGYYIMTIHLPAFCKGNDKDFILKCVVLQYISEFKSNWKNVIYTSSKQVIEIYTKLPVTMSWDVHRSYI